MAEQKQFLLTTAELASFQHALLHTPSVTLRGSLSQGTLEMTTALGTVKLSYTFASATGSGEAANPDAVGTLTVTIADKPQWWPAEQIFKQISSLLGLRRAAQPTEAHA